MCSRKDGERQRERASSENARRAGLHTARVHRFVKHDSQQTQGAHGVCCTQVWWLTGEAESAAIMMEMQRQPSVILLSLLRQVQIYRF